MTNQPPGEPWDDDRVVAALKARAAQARTPPDLASATRAAVRTGAAATPPWRGLLASAAVVVLALGVITGSFALLGGQHTTTDPTAIPSAYPTGNATASEGVTPREAIGLPVVSVEDAIKIRDGGDDEEVAVRGWFSPIGPMPCPAPATWPVTPVEPNCPDAWVVLMADPESLVTVGTGFDGRSPTGPSIQVDLDDLDLRWQPSLPDLGPAEPVEVVVIGHFDDRRSFACPPEVQQACRDRFVVDRVDSANGEALPLSVVGADGGQTSATAAVEAVVAEETPGDSILSMAVVDGPTGIGRIEPSLGTGRGGFIDEPWMWVVRVLEGDRSVTYLVIDGTDAIFEMDREGVPVPVGGSARPTGAPSPGAFATFRFDLVGSEGPVVPMTVVDASRRLIAARSATPEELGRPGPEAEPGRLAVDELSPGTLLVRWGGGVCDSALKLIVETGVPINLGLRGDHPPCDAMGIGRGVVLSLFGDIRADHVTTEDLQRVVEALPSKVAGLDVIDIQSALNLRTEPGNDRELAVAGWYWRDPTLQCAAFSVSPPLLDPDCPDDHDRLVETPDVDLAEAATFRPVMGEWTRTLLPGPWWSTRLILIGHFDDRRSSACAPERQAACADAFWVDAVWVHGQIDDEDWRRTGPNGQSSIEPTKRRPEVEAAALGLRPDFGPVLTVGAIPGRDLQYLEPTADISLLRGETWIWHITLLDHGRIRTLLIPDRLVGATEGVVGYEVAGEALLTMITIID